ncbi:MAG: DUF3592 domain-containing protein [Terracidiphilus sp.]
MLIQLWKLVRGIYWWRESTATVEDVDRSQDFEWPKDTGHDQDGLFVRYRRGRRVLGFIVIAFHYQDRQQTSHTGCYKVNRNSAFYKLNPGDTFPLRYHPSKPEKYYAPGLDAEFEAEARLNFLFVPIVSGCVLTVVCLFAYSLYLLIRAVL